MANELARGLQLNDTLKTINLGNNSYMGAAGIRVIAGALNGVEVFDLSYSFDSDEGAAPALALADALRDNVVLKIIYLNSEQSEGEGRNALHELLASRHGSLRFEEDPSLA